MAQTVWLANGAIAINGSRTVWFGATALKEAASTINNLSLSASTSPAATLSRQSHISVLAASSPLSMLLREVQKVVLASVLPTAALSRAVELAQAAVVSPSATLTRQSTTTISTSVSASATLDAVKAFLLDLQATCSPTALLTSLKTFALTLSAETAPLASLIRAIAKTIAVSTSPRSTQTSIPSPEDIVATPVIDRLRPIPRQQGIQVPDVVSASRWIDAIALSASTAASYTLPVDADGNKATLLRLSSTAGPIYFNWNGTAAIPTTVTDGTASAIIHPDLQGEFVVAPLSTDTLSLICASSAKVTIEAWN